MAAEEVIYFPFWAQPYQRPNSLGPSPPEPVAEPPPLAIFLMRPDFGLRRDSCV
jgi:hypothetical protein